MAGVVFQRTIQRESRPVISVDLPLRPDHPNGNSPFNLVPNDLPMGPSRIHGAQCTLLVLDEVIDFRHVVVVRIGRGLELLIPFVGPFLRLDVVNHRPASVDVIAQTRVKRTQAAQQAFVHVDGVRRISRSREHLLMIPAELDPTFKEASEDLGKCVRGMSEQFSVEVAFHGLHVVEPGHHFGHQLRWCENVLHRLHEPQAFVCFTMIS